MVAKAEGGDLPHAAWGKPLDMFREHACIADAAPAVVDLACNEQLDADEEPAAVDLVCSEQLDADEEPTTVSMFDAFDLARMLIPVPAERMPLDVAMDMDLDITLG